MPGPAGPTGRGRCANPYVERLSDTLARQPTFMPGVINDFGIAPDRLKPIPALRDALPPFRGRALRPEGFDPAAMGLP
jgi:hypothetical protein